MGTKSDYQLFWEAVSSYGGDTTIPSLFVFIAFLSAVILFLSEGCSFFPQEANNWSRWVEWHIKFTWTGSLSNENVHGPPHVILYVI